MKKRILSLSLALLMVLALLPFGARAANDFSCYETLIRRLTEQSPDGFYGAFFDFDSDGASELLAVTPGRGNTPVMVEVYKMDAESAALLDSGVEFPLDPIMRDYFWVMPPIDTELSVFIVANSDGELGLLMQVSGSAYGTSGEYEGLIGDTLSEKLWLYRDDRFVRPEEGRGTVWHTPADQSGEIWYAPSLSRFTVNDRDMTQSEFQLWFERVIDPLTVIAELSPNEARNGLRPSELLALTQTGFYDVPADQYYAAPVMWAAEKGVTNGTSRYTFSPENPCTRGQVVTFLWRAAGSPEPKNRDNPFADVKPSDYFYKAVLWAAEQEITNGMDETHFGPEAACTRAHVVTFLWRSHGRPAAGGHNPFTDVEKGVYYTNAVLWAVENEITNGMDETHFGPDSTCIRGQIVTFLYRDLAE